MKHTSAENMLQNQLKYEALPSDFDGYNSNSIVYTLVRRLVFLCTIGLIAVWPLSGFAQNSFGVQIEDIRWSGNSASHAEFVIAHSGLQLPRIEFQNEQRKRIRFLNTQLPKGITNLRSKGIVIGVFPQQDGNDALIDVVTNTSFELIVRAVSKNIIVQVVPHDTQSVEKSELTSFEVNTLPNGAVAVELRSKHKKQPIVTNVTDGVRILWSGVKLAANFALAETKALEHLDSVRVLSRSPMELELKYNGMINSDLIAIDDGYLLILLPGKFGQAPTMSLDFKAISSAEIIRALMDQAKLNVLFESIPDQPISLVATNISPYRALAIIAKKTDSLLDYSILDNRWFINKRKIEQYQHQVYPLKHARATELEEVLGAQMLIGDVNVKEPKGDDEIARDTISHLESANSNADSFGENHLGQNKVITSNIPVHIRADIRSNSLIISGSSVELEVLSRVIERLDQPQMQIEVEALIVEIDKEFARSLGVKWGARRTIDYPRVLGFEGADRAIASGSGLSASNPLAPLTDSEYNVDLGAGNIGTDRPATFGLSLIASEAGLSDYFNVQLSALEAEGLAKVLARPRLMTSNHYSASIEQGVERLFEVANEQDATLVSKRAVLGIEVTPHVYASNDIQLELVVKQDSFDAMDQSAMHTKRISSTIRAKNNETIALGGIYQKEEYSRNTGLPMIRKIPFFKWLFSNEMKGEDVRELLVLLTPRIEIPAKAELNFRPFTQPVPKRS